MALMTGFEPAWATLVGGNLRSHHCAILYSPCCLLVVMKIATLK